MQTLLGGASQAMLALDVICGRRWRFFAFIPALARGKPRSTTQDFDRRCHREEVSQRLEQYRQS